MTSWTRRDFIAAGTALTSLPALAKGDTMITKPIPTSGEALPVIGLGTYSVFDVASSAEAIAERRTIVERLTAAGGSVIDTSPMYNRSERVIGDVIEAGADRSDLFLATKVWTDGEASGTRQMQVSADLMKTDVIDLMQVHNLRDTDVHMASIRELQQDGRIRYNGLTHYTAGSHAALARAMEKTQTGFYPDQLLARRA